MAKTLDQLQNGDDMEGGESFCDDIYNNLKNHWRANYGGDPCASGGLDYPQPGMIISDEYDNKLYHVTMDSGCPCTEIVQTCVPVSGNVIMLGILSVGGIGLDGNLDMGGNDIVNVNSLVFGASAPAIAVGDTDDLLIIPAAGGDAKFFSAAAAGENPYLHVCGFKTADVTRYWRVNVDADGFGRVESELGMTLAQSGGKLGFYGLAVPIVKPAGVAVDAAGIHAALVSLGLIAA